MKSPAFILLIKALSVMGLTGFDSGQK